MSNPTNAPTSRAIGFAALVLQVEGPAYYEPDVAYKFPVEREFKSTDAQDSGIYE